MPRGGPGGGRRGKDCWDLATLSFEVHEHLVFEVSSVMKSELYERMWDLLKRKVDFGSGNFSHKGFT